MNRFLKLFAIVLICVFAYAKEYKVNILVDENITKYASEIKEETKNVFFSSDNLIFNIEVCSLNCAKLLKEDFDIAIYQATQNRAKQKHKKTYLINYDKIDSNYDKQRVIKASSLAIYEYLEEKKVDFIFLKSIELFSKKAQNKDKKESLKLEDLATLIKKNSYNYKQNENSLNLNFLDVQEAKSSFKPKISLFSNYAQIDEDRAKASQGQYPQKQLTAGVKIKQLLYSNQALKNIKIKKLLHKASKQDLKASNDELLYEAMLLYLNINKATKQKNIIYTKKEFIEKNLLFSKQRVQIGIESRADIYRWESELANVNIQLSNTKQQLQKLKYELYNKLGLEDEFDFVSYSMQDQYFKLLSKDAINYLQKPKVQKLFFNFVVQEHPFLKNIEKSLQAKKEQVFMNEENFYLPKLAFEGSYKKHLSKEGKGSNIPVPWDNKEFEAVINLSFDLYNSSLKDIKLQRSKLEYIDLKLAYNKTKDLIKKNLMTNYYSLNKSYKNIEYSKNALLSSKKNLELMQDRYDKKTINIIELLDAQNRYWIAKIDHNISITNYLQNLISIYFFIGKIDLLLDDNIKKDVENRINDTLKGNR